MDGIDALSRSRCREWRFNDATAKFSLSIYRLEYRLTSTNSVTHVIIQSHTQQTHCSRSSPFHFVSVFQLYVNNNKTVEHFESRAHTSANAKCTRPRKLDPAYRQNGALRPMYRATVDVCEMLLLKFPAPQWWEVEKCSGIRIIQVIITINS